MKAVYSSSFQSNLLLSVFGEITTQNKQFIWISSSKEGIREEIYYLTHPFNKRHKDYFPTDRQSDNEA